MSKELIVKHNDLIEGRYNLTLIEAKLIAKLVSVIEKDDEDFKCYKFQAKELLSELQLGSEHYSELKGHVDKLVTKKIQLDQGSSLLTTTFFSSAEYFDDSTVELEFSPKLKPYLLQLKDNFTKYFLEDILCLKSFYAIRIYELSKQYQNLKERIIELKELREILGIEKTKYRLYGHFKEKVLEISEREINEKTDLKISFEEIKTGRKVTSIKFIIEKNVVTGNIHEIQDIDFPPKKSDNLSKLFLVCKVQIDEVKNFISENIEKYSTEVFESNIKYTNKYAKDNYLAYLKKALKEDYARAIREQKAQKPVQKKIPVIEEKEQIDLSNLTASEKEHLAKVQKSIFNK